MKRTVLLTAMLLGCGPKAPPAPPVAAVPTPVVSTQAVSLRVVDALTDPKPLEQLMSGYFDTRVAIQPVAGPDGVALLVGSADTNGAQAACTPTTRVPVTPGAFSVTAPSLPLETDGTPFQAMGLAVSGTLSADALALTELRTTVDAAAFVALLGSSDPNALCAMTGDNVPCGPCPSGDAATCWALTLSSPALTPMTAPLVEQDIDQLCASAECRGAASCAGR
jgi:hypothetical protein